MSELHPSAERARAATIGLLLALIGVAFVATVRESASGVSLALLGAFLLLPLVLPLRGIVRRHRRAYAWASLCLTPHFIYGLTEIVANPAMRPIAAAMLLLSLALMVALVAYLRLTRPTQANLG